MYFTFRLKATLDQGIVGPSAYVIFSNGVARSKRLGTTVVDFLQVFQSDLSWVSVCSQVCLPCRSYVNLMVLTLSMWLTHHDHQLQFMTLIFCSYIWSTRSKEGCNKHPLLFITITNHTDRTFFLWRLHCTWHDLHILVTAPFCSDQKSRAESAQRFTLVPSNNRNYMPYSLYYCLFMPHIYGSYSSCTSHSWWIAHATPHWEVVTNK